jgi:glutathione peroxidase
MPRWVLAALASLVMLGLIAARPAAEGGAAPPGATSLLDLEARRLAGPVESLAVYRGQVLLIVNTASRCGFTPQYEGLQSLHERYRGRGFSVLGFPSNDFREQEPGNDAEIGAFCQANYGVEFPMFSKVKVLGDDAHPVYAHLTSRPAPVGGPVEWNFQKYLVDRSGRVVQRFSPRTAPDAPEVVAAIERALAEPVPDPATALPR